MAPENGRSAAPLIEELLEHGSTFEFFQAVRLLARAQPDRELPGGDGDPDREAVRFRSDVSMAFPTSDIRKVESGREGRPPEMTVAFYGLATPASWGSLPTGYAELILSRAKKRDLALRDFLDLFNHRLLSLFYRAWEKHRFPLVYERSSARSGGLFEHLLFAVVGLGTRGVRGRLAVSDLGLLRWSAMLSRRPASAGEIEDWVRDFFGVDAEVTPFVPAWYVVEDDERLLLGRGARLGRDAFLGDSVLVAQSRFALRVGPLTRAQYGAFLPGGACFRELGEVLQMAAGPEYDFEVRLRLHREEVPALRLRGPDTPGARLGWTTWLLTRPLARDPEDVVISGDRALGRAN